MLYILAVITLLLSGFFSGIEIAFVSSNRLRIELKKQAGSRRGKLLASFFEKPSEFLGMTLVGNNLALVIFGTLMAKILEQPVLDMLGGVRIEMLEFLKLLTITIFSTIIVLIFGEFIPKLLFQLNPSRILYFLTYPLKLIELLLTPLVWVMVKLSYGLISLLVKNKDEIVKPERVFGRGDLEHFIKDINQDNDEEIDTELFENALYLNNVRVSECMVPRTEIVGVDIKNGVEELKRTFIDSGLSKIIIYDDSLDNILGYVHHQQILYNPEKMEDIVVFSIPIVPEVTPAKDLMNRFIKKQVSIACIVDEFGGTAGICTLEDILEELVGEIEDEHDEEEYMEKQISENEYLFSGRLEIDYLNESFKLYLPEGDYHTLSGYLVTTTEEIPQEGQLIILEGYEFIIESMSGTKIDTVRVRRLFSNEDE